MVLINRQSLYTGGLYGRFNYISYLNLCGIGIATLDNRHGEMRHEIWQGAKFSRKHKIKQWPQLFQVVLYWWPWQNDSMTCAELERKTMKRHVRYHKSEAISDVSRIFVLSHYWFHIIIHVFSCFHDIDVLHCVWLLLLLQSIQMYCNSNYYYYEM